MIGKGDAFEKTVYLRLKADTGFIGWEELDWKGRNNC